MRIVLFFIVSLFLGGCSVKGGYELQQNAMVFVDNDKTVIQEFEDAIKKRRHDRCTLQAYTIDDENLHLEYVRLYPHCQWQGLPSSAYKIFFKQYIKPVALVQRFKEGRFDISLYEFDGKKFYFIATYDGVSDLFILDYKGKFASKVCNRCEMIDIAQRIDFRFDKSIVQQNFFHRYFLPQKRQRIFPIYPH